MRMEATAPLVVAAAAAGVAAACCCQPTLRPAAPRIPRPAEFRRKREALVRGGARNLAVISDFDRTITRCFTAAGERCQSCYNVADGALTPEMAAYKQQVFEHYFPIEKDPNLTVDEKRPFMLEWYRKSNESLVSGGFRRDSLRSAVSEAVAQRRLELREGFGALLASLQAHRTPVLIFSAGISNVISEIFAQLLPSVPLAPSTQVVGNTMTFSDDGVLTRFEDPLIHMFNKNQSVVPAGSQRRHVLLLGDGLGDVTMADEAATEPEIILKIGFLNENVEGLLPQYEAAFDMVIVGDGSFSPVTDIVQAVINSD